MPKETARRKISELEKDQVLIKKAKNLIIDKRAFDIIKQSNTTKNLSNIFYSVSKILFKERLIQKELKKEDIVNLVKKNFTFTWHHYYKFIFLWLFNWKKFFDNDSVLFIIWGIPMLHRAHKMKNNKNLDLDISQWRTEIENIKTQGINTMSLSDITGVPRPTVTRKLKILIDKKLLIMDKNKLIHPGIIDENRDELYKIQNICLNSFSEFNSTIFNEVLFN